MPASCLKKRPLSSRVLLLLAISLLIAVGAGESVLRYQEHSLPTLHINTLSESSLEPVKGNSILHSDELPEAPGSSEMSRLEASSLFRQALEYSRSGDTRAATVHYQALLHNKPNHQMAAINLAIIQIESGQCEEALPVLRHAREIAGTTRKGKVYALTAQCLAAQGQMDIALAHYERSILFRPAHAPTWRKYATALGQAGRPYTEVALAHKRALALSPNRSTFWLDWADYQFRHLDFHGAIDTLENSDRAKRLKESLHWRRYRLLSLSYLEVAKLSSAKRIFEEVKKAVSGAPTLYDQALFELAAKNRKKAGSLLSGIEAETDEVRVVIALTLQTLKHYREAETIWQEMSDSPRYGSYAQFKRASVALKSADNNVDSLSSSARLDKAKWLLDSLLLKPVEHSTLYHHHALLYGVRNDASASEASILKALDLKPDNRSYQLILARTHSTLGRHKEALELMQRLALKYPNNRKITRQWARSMWQAEMPEQAIDKYRQLTKTNAKHYDLRQLAGWLQAEGKIEATNQVLQQLLDLKQNDIPARYQLANNLCQLGETTACHNQAKLILRLNDSHEGANRLLMSPLS